MAKKRITEALDIDLESEMWCCHRCGVEIHSARESYVKGSLVYERPANEIYGEAFQLSKDVTVSYTPNPDFMRIIEFYCPGCGALFSIQYLPPGHPVPIDIQLDIDMLKAKEKGSSK